MDMYQCSTCFKCYSQWGWASKHVEKKHHGNGRIWLIDKPYRNEEYEAQRAAESIAMDDDTDVIRSR